MHTHDVATRLLLPALLLCALGGLAAAEVDFVLTRNAPATYTAGATLDVTVSLALATGETVTAMGLEETLPAGWQYQSVVSGNTPQITPTPGKEGLLEFAWFPVPGAFPLDFTYRVLVPQGATGNQQLSGNGVGRTLESGVIVTLTVLTPVAEPGVPVPDVIGLTQAAASTALTNAGFSVGSITEELSVTMAAGFVKRTSPRTGESVPAGATVDLVLSLGPGAVHDGDTVADGVISLNELLRVIQFFNSGGYSCADGQATEDGFVPGSTNPRTCDTHDVDSDGDWSISLVELLRFIQFYNSGGYHECPDEVPPTEDGFCPGI
jgi:hypothetical protein